MSEKKTIGIMYVPAIHAGIISFAANLSQIYIIDTDILTLIDTEFDYLRKEIRALSPEQALTSLQALFPQKSCSLLTKKKLKALDTSQSAFLLPNEDIFQWLSKTHLSRAKVSFSSTFLRWNRDNSVKKNTVTAPMSLAFKAAEKSSDWWRQVGCAVVKDTKVILVSHNRHLPSPYTPYIDSDPRNSFHKGKNIELSTAIHAEAELIARAAKQGISLNGTTLYVTTFPCPTCAKLIAVSGITDLYFYEGYSVLDGEKVLKDAGVSIKKLNNE